MYSHSFKCTVKNDKWWHAKVHVILNVFSKMKMKLNYLFLKILVSPFLWSFIKHTSSYFHSKWRRYLYWRKTLIVKWPLQHHKDQMRQLPTGNPPETHLACQGWWCQSPQRPLSQCDLWPVTRLGLRRRRWEEGSGCQQEPGNDPHRNWQPPPKFLVMWPQTWFKAPLPTGEEDSNLP